MRRGRLTDPLALNLGGMSPDGFSEFAVESLFLRSEALFLHSDVLSALASKDRLSLSPPERPVDAVPTESAGPSSAGVSIGPGEGAASATPADTRMIVASGHPAPLSNPQPYTTFSSLATPSGAPDCVPMEVSSNPLAEQWGGLPTQCSPNDTDWMNYPIAGAPLPEMNSPLYHMPSMGLFGSSGMPDMGFNGFLGGTGQLGASADPFAGLDMTDTSSRCVSLRMSQRLSLISLHDLATGAGLPTLGSLTPSLIPSGRPDRK